MYTERMPFALCFGLHNESPFAIYAMGSYLLLLVSITPDRPGPALLGMLMTPGRL
jgi:hypothetical protein